MSVTYQISLPDDLAAELEATAADLHLPLAEFIRDSVERRLLELRLRGCADPFQSITGLIKSDERDLSARIDEILYCGKAFDSAP